MLEAYIHTKEDDGKGVYNCYGTVEVPVKTTDTPRSGQTASGYGRRMPTQYMVKYNNKWRRVYCICFSNAGTLYIGKTYTPKMVVDIYQGGDNV